MDLLIIAVEIGVAIFLIWFGIIVLIGNRKPKSNYVFMNGTLDLSEDEIEILKSTNLYRIGSKLPTLKSDKFLNKLAKKRVGAMIFDNKLSHRGFYKISNVLVNMGVNGMSENIGYGYEITSDAVKHWFESDSHRENLEGNYLYTGIAIGEGRNNRKWYCQIFVR